VNTIRILKKKVNTIRNLFGNTYKQRDKLD